MRVAFVGDFINHGKFLVPSSTSIVLLLSKVPDVEIIDVYSPILNNKTEPFKEPKNVKIIESYKYDNLVSIIKLLKIRNRHYDKIIFNIMPTAFGNGSFANLTGLLVPLVLSMMFRKKNIEIIYHNSVYTNDISKLGYDSSYDKIRSFILSIVERVIFKSVKTFVFLEFYKDIITRRIGRNKVRVLNGRYFEAITTIYLNGLFDCHYLSKVVNYKTPQVLMHGYWGPQKNIELGLDALIELRNQGIHFDLTISGSINSHFEEYGKQFDLLLENSKKILKKYEGFVNEIGIMNLFKNTDLLILPYNTPGGRSAVLEQAIFFEVQTIAINFPEFREQADKMRFVGFINSEEDLKSYAKKILIDREFKNTEINIKEKIQQAITNIQKLLE